MFEKEAEEYAKEHCTDACKNLQAKYKKVFKDGAKYGYNKSKKIIQSFVWWHTGEDRGSIDSSELIERANQFLKESKGGRE